MSSRMRTRLVISWQVFGVLASLLIFLPGRCGIITAQDGQPKDGRHYESLALKAYQAKNYALFLENMERAVSLRPNHPRLMYNLAAANALNARPGEALLWLRKVARMGLVFAPEADSDFAALKGSAEFTAVLEQFRRNTAPLVESSPAFTLHEKGLVPESVAYDPATKSFYLSSVYRRKIVRVDARGEATDFATEREGLWSVMGLKVDAPRRLLWACTVAHRQMSDFREAEDGTSALLKFDLRTGRLLKRYVLSNSPQHHWLGDLAINSAGDVFATDSLTPAIYVVRRGQPEIEQFLASEQFASPQGLDFAPDEKRLFMADYAKGIFIIELATKEVRELPLVTDATLLGIDGLYFYRGALIGVQNGVNPNRLIRLDLSRDFSRVERFQIIEANNPIFDEPTLGVLVKNQFYFIANSQWGAIDRKGQLAAAEKLKEPTVLRLNLR